MKHYITLLTLLLAPLAALQAADTFLVEDGQPPRQRFCNRQTQQGAIAGDYKIDVIQTFFIQRA